MASAAERTDPHADAADRLSSEVRCLRDVLEVDPEETASEADVSLEAGIQVPGTVRRGRIFFQPLQAESQIGTARTFPHEPEGWSFVSAS
ncbi:MAG: hypothetical protein WCK86_10495 [Planctomycetia bacterium]